MANASDDKRPWYRTRWTAIAGVVLVLAAVVVVVVAVSGQKTTPRGTAADAVPTTVQSRPVTTTTISPLLTTTSTAPPRPPIAMSALEAAAATQSGLGVGTTAKCGPAPTGLGVGSYVACGLDSPSGISEEIIQMTGTTASSFNVVIGPGSGLSCRAFNSGELAAWTAQDQVCAQNG